MANFDKSIIYSSQLTPLKNKRNRQLISREDTLNLSPIFNDTSIFKNLNDTSLRHVLDESSILWNQVNAGENLSDAFFEIIQSCRSSNVLDVLVRLSKVCCDSLESVEPCNRYNAQNFWLAEEANTWKLLHCLYADSITEHPESLDTLITDTTLSQQTLVDALFRSDSELRLLQILVDWLEATAAYQEEVTQTLAPIAESVHWGHTSHELLFGASFFNKEKNKAMVTCVDPDAPRRQRKIIHTDDQKDDNDLCRRIFTKVRCGKFQDAVSLCINTGQSWRAAVLQGWRLLHYFEKQDAYSPLDISGNPSRDLWKWCALGLATNTAENIYYRATVGIMSGYLPSSLPVCQESWEDLLWAHLRVQIEVRVDKFLHEHHATVDANTTPSDVLALLQGELQVEELSLVQIFSAVQALMNSKKESLYQNCQRYLMLGHVRAIMQDSLEWIENSDERFIRFLAHLILILREMGKDPHHDIGDKILEKYITQLVSRLVDGSVERPEVIAYYTSHVPVTRQIELYAELMDHIYKSVYREGVVKAGLNVGLNVATSARVAIKKAIADVQQGYGNLELAYTQTSAVEKDKTLIQKVISSLDWLFLIGNQQEEALWLSNAMIRTFIFIGNSDAAMACVTNVNERLPEFMNKISSDSSELREHLSLKAYLEAVKEFALWYRFFMTGRPKDVKPLPPDASFSDKVHHEQICAQIEQQKACWSKTVRLRASNTKNLLYKVLLFPRGWLQDESDSSTSLAFSDDEKKERSKQLESLRGLCIPEIALLILKILQSTDNIEDHKEAVKLSNIIAGENNCLYKIFSKAKLMEVLERIKESSLFLLEKGRDIFGYEI